MSKAADLRAKSADQLKAEILDLRKAQLNFRIQKATGQLAGTGVIRTTRRDIARAKTVMNEQKSGKAPAAKAAPAKKAAAPKKKKASKE